MAGIYSVPYNFNFPIKKSMPNSASLFKVGGMVLIHDMLPRAEKIKEVEAEMHRLKVELGKLEMI